MTILIIIYLIIVCWYKFSNLKQKSSLMVNNNGEVLIELFTLIYIFYFFFKDFEFIQRNSSFFFLKI